jgi:hypothetical protein
LPPTVGASTTIVMESGSLVGTVTTVESAAVALNTPSEVGPQVRGVPAISRSIATCFPPTVPHPRT